jgi:hypothetical protein
MTKSIAGFFRAEEVAMKQARTAAALILIVLGAIASDSVLAAGRHGGGGGHRGGSWHGGGTWHGGHSGGARLGLGGLIGAPLLSYYATPYYAPSYYYPPTYSYPPSYYYPPVVAAPAYPPAYVERNPVQAAPAQPQANWWYYCADAKSYYPYIRECPTGWTRVSPQPPSG